MDHAKKAGESTVPERCSPPLTGAGVVDMVITDLCVMSCEKANGGGQTLIEPAPGVTLDEVRAKTGAPFTVPQPYGKCGRWVRVDGTCPGGPVSREQPAPRAGAGLRSP